MEPETVPPKPSNKKLLGLVLIFLLVLFAGVCWYFYSQNSSSETSQTKDKTATTSAKVETTSSQTPNNVDDETLIKEALVVKTGIAADVIDVTISQKVDTFAKGLVGAKGEEIGGGYFLAVKVNGAWIIAFDGQSTPGCSAVDPYNFPASMAPECVDNSGNIITRQ